MGRADAEDGEAALGQPAGMVGVDRARMGGVVSDNESRGMNAKTPERRGRSIRFLRIVISVSAIVVAAVHLIWPKLTIDAITLGLLFLAIIPWLSPLVKSLELPGGWKLEFQDLDSIKQRAETAGLVSPNAKPLIEGFFLQTIAKQDPNLALAGLRIEIEKRLRILAADSDLSVQRTGIGQLLKALRESEVLSLEQQSVLSDLTGVLNSAVHGDTVDQDTAYWAIEWGLRLLESLDEKISITSSQQ